MKIVKLLACSLLFSFYLSGLSHASGKFRVVDVDTNKGISAYIDKVDNYDKTKRVSNTGKNGYVKQEFTCYFPKKLRITPLEHRSYYFQTVDCPVSKNVVYLRSNKRQTNLVKNAEWSTKKEDFGTAALAYTEAAYHASSMKNNRQQDLGIKAYKAVASYLAIADGTVFDKKQNRLVMSPQLQEAIVNLQNKKGIKVTGALDFQTLSVISNKSLSDVLFSPPNKKKGE